MRVTRGHRRWAIIALAVIGAFPVAASGEDDVIDVICAMDARWTASHPSRVELTEHSTLPPSPRTLHFVIWDDDIWCRRRSFARGVQLTEIETAKVVREEVHVRKSGRWMAASPTSTGFEAVASSTIIDVALGQSAPFLMRTPIGGQSVSERLRDRACVVRQEFDGEVAVLQIAANGSLGSAMRRGDVIGRSFIGWVVHFDRTRDFRPVRVLQCSTASTYHDASRLPTVEFGAQDVVVEKEIAWTEWTALGEAWIPTHTEVTTYTSGSGALETALRYESSCDAHAIETIPDGVVIELRPPAEYGTRGIVRDVESGAVVIHDAEGAAGLLAGRDAAIADAARGAGDGGPLPWGGLRMAGILLMGLCAALLAYVVARRLLGRAA